MQSQAESLTTNCTHLTESAFRRYWDTALWSTTDETDEYGGNPLDNNYTLDDVDKGAIAQSITECEDFLALCDREGLLEKALEFQTLEHIMHDFWLTRNGHGVGFWEPGDYGQSGLGNKLTELTKPYGEVNLYVGDDGIIYAY